LCDPAVVVQYQTDLPPIVPIVTQFNIETGYCPCCRQHWQGRHPEQTSDALGAAGNTLGPVVLTMAAEMKHRLGASYRKICDFLATYSDLHVAPATFVRAEQRLADRARPTYDLLLEALRQSHVVHVDETGWRIGRLNAWLWVFSSKDVTIYAIRPSRGTTCLKTSSVPISKATWWLTVSRPTTCSKSPRAGATATYFADARCWAKRSLAALLLGGNRRVRSARWQEAWFSAERRCLHHDRPA
jgi:transposase